MNLGVRCMAIRALDESLVFDSDIFSCSLERGRIAEAARKRADNGKQRDNNERHIQVVLGISAHLCLTFSPGSIPTSPQQRSSSRANGSARTDSLYWSEEPVLRRHQPTLVSKNLFFHFKNIQRTRRSTHPSSAENRKRTGSAVSNGGVASCRVLSHLLMRQNFGCDLSTIFRTSRSLVPGAVTERGERWETDEGVETESQSPSAPPFRNHCLPSFFAICPAPSPKGHTALP